MKHHYHYTHFYPYSNMAVRSQQRLGIHKEERRAGYPEDTLLTQDNYGKIMVNKEALLLICNRVSAMTKRKLTPTEVDGIRLHIRRMPESQLYGRTYGNGIAYLAQSYLNRSMRYEEQDDLRNIARLDDNDLHEVQKAEVLQLSKNEHDWAFRAHVPRTGESIIDAEKVEGARSIPNGISPVGSLPNGVNGSIQPPGVLSSPNNGMGGGVPLEEYNKVAIPALKALQEFLSPNNINNLATKFRNNQTFDTYNRISLSRQQVLLDSRNRSLADDRPNARLWNIFTAGSYGNQGSVMLRDTLQNIVEMELAPFWIPVPTTRTTYYGMITMEIPELQDQSTPITEFLQTGSQRVIKTDFYSWLLKIEKVTGDLMYLVPLETKLRFRFPVARLEHLTLRFWSPYEELQLQQDFLSFTMTYGVSTILTNPTDNGNAVLHNITTGDLIYVYSSNTGNLTLDSVLSQKTGYFATRINSTTISIPVDTSVLSGSQIVNVFIGSKRLNVQFRFTCLDAAS